MGNEIMTEDHEIYVTAMVKEAKPGEDKVLRIVCSYGLKKLQRRFTLGRQSSGAPANDAVLASDATDSLDAAMDSGVRLMYLANEGDLEDSGAAGFRHHRQFQRY
ncbi:hypothetical protein DH2020_031824 [Rehmannia glutinosa]|uniref:Uncharacterized protein n=1 Tax=Rehmannia glutinosa TaxID=99300 RepID=A0ABR0VJT2_REHGL